VAENQLRLHRQINFLLFHLSVWANLKQLLSNKDILWANKVLSRNRQRPATRWQAIRKRRRTTGSQTGQRPNQARMHRTNLHVSGSFRVCCRDADRLQRRKDRFSDRTRKAWWAARRWLRRTALSTANRSSKYVKASRTSSLTVSTSTLKVERTLYAHARVPWSIGYHMGVRVPVRKGAPRSPRIFEVSSWWNFNKKRQYL